MEPGDSVIPIMLGEGHPLWEHTLIALLTVWVIHRLMEPHLMEPIIIVHMQPILMVLLLLAEDLAEAEEWEEDGGKLDCIGISLFQTG